MKTKKKKSKTITFVRQVYYKRDDGKPTSRDFGLGPGILYQDEVTYDGKNSRYKHLADDPVLQVGMIHDSTALLHELFGIHAIPKTEFNRLRKKRKIDASSPLDKASSSKV